MGVLLPNTGNLENCVALDCEPVTRFFFQVLFQFKESWIGLSSSGQLHHQLSNRSHSRAICWQRVFCPLCAAGVSAPAAVVALWSREKRAGSSMSALAQVA